MGFERWSALAGQHRRTMILVAMLTTFAGVALLIDRPKGTVLEWFALPLTAVGGAIFAWAVWPRFGLPQEASPSLASHFLRHLTFHGRLVRLFPAIGVGIILADFMYNLLLSATPSLQTEDIIVLLAAATLLGYGFVPARFAREREFVLLFFMCLNAILVVPLLVARAFYADFERSVDLYSWVALAPETSAVLNLLGVINMVHPVAGSTAPGLTFQPPSLGIQVTVVITTACSGIYSFGIFASAFVAFVLAEYDRLTRRIWLLLALGLMSSYIANVLRMVVIVLVGYYADSGQADLQNMLIAHSYAGWIIFLAWIALFWGALFKFLSEARPSLTAGAQHGTPARKESRCGICSIPLSPSLPATRCVCGAYYHRACLASQGRCPTCGNPPKLESAVVPDGS